MSDLLARDAIALRGALDATTDDVVDVHLSLPRETADLVLRLMEAQQRGGAVVIPAKKEFTPNEVATILGVSRSEVYRLVEEGRLAHRMVGTHRRIPAASLTAYQAEEKKRQREAMAELTRLSNEFGFTE